MGRIRISIAGLMAVVAVSGVVLASLRAESGVGVNLVFGIALALNFAAVAAVPTGLAPRIRVGALGYALCGWGWMAAVALVPAIDSFLRDEVVVPGLTRPAAPGAKPNVLASGPSVHRLLLLGHSLCVIAAGSAGASLAWALGARLADPDSSTTLTTGPS